MGFSSSKPAATEAADNPVLRRVLLVVSVVALLVSLLKGAAFPHHWAASHMLLTYDHGFVKRGLLGTLVKAVTYEVPYTGLFFLAAGVLWVNVMMIGEMGLELLRSRYAYVRYAPPLFAASYGVAYLANTMGYLDHIGLLAAIVVIRIRRFWLRMVVAWLLFVPLIFMHEAQFIIFAPVMMLTFFLEPAFWQRRRWLIATLLLGVVLILLTYMVSGATIPKESAMAMFEAAKARTAFHVDKGVFDVLHRDGWDNLDIMLKVWSSPQHPGLVSYGLAVCLPTVWLFLYLCARILRRAGTPRLKIVLMVLAGHSPLLLHLFGWDIYRWSTLAVTTSFLVLFHVAARFNSNAEAPASSDATAPPSSAAEERAAGDPDATEPAAGEDASEPDKTEPPAAEPPASDGAAEPAASPRFPALVPAICAVLFTFNISASLTGLNGAKAQPFPFRGHIEYLIRVAMGKRGFPRVPRPPKPKDERKNAPKKKPGKKFKNKLMQKLLRPAPPKR